MPGISLLSSARGSEVSANSPLPSGLIRKVLDLARIAEGATGLPPSGCSELCEMRPTCQSCTTILPPACVHGVGHLLPAGELLGRVEARHVGIALALMA